ncbi:MAG: aminotransferase class III-fold pyridoxal phosphate-dependent enzyme, partial [Deltaproteobacteria bacterium]|nr:aminotransferase class III-fold pyridoxal phosphate-dependent enzyme [Deltaproteobacteria bacterium]
MAPVVKHSAGARFLDLDGNDYLDFSLSMGVLGHNPPFVAEAVSRMLDRGLPGEGALSDAARQAAALAAPLLCPGGKCAFFSSEGTAMRAAALLARAATGRRLVAAFSRNLPGLKEHLAFGSFDSGGADAGGPARAGGGNGQGGFEEAGGVLLLEYGSERALSALAEAAPRLAAAFVEPAPSADLRFQSPSYLARLCRAARDRGAAVVFDETVLGPGFLPGGSGAWLGSEADISVWGPSLSGGLPLGAVACSENFLSRLDVRGTAAALGAPPHPLALAALAGAMGWHAENTRSYRERAGALVESLSLRLNLWFQEKGAPLRLKGFGPFFRFRRLGPAPADLAGLEGELFRLLLLESGVYAGARESRSAGRVLAVSAAHGPDDARRLADAAVRAVQALREGGFGFASARGAPRVYSELAGERARAFAAPEGESVAPSGREAVCFRLDGQPSAELLKDSLLELSSRHEALNRSLRLSSEGAWLKTEDEAPMRLRLVSDFASETDADAVKPFLGPRDPGEAPLAGAALIERGSYSVFLVESLSAAVDRESLKILLRDLDALMRRQIQLVAPEDLAAAEAEVERYLLSPPSWALDGVKGRAELSRERWAGALSEGRFPRLPLDNPLLKGTGRARLVSSEISGPQLDAYRAWSSRTGISPEVFVAGALAMALARAFEGAPGPYLFGRLWLGRPGPDSRGAVGPFARTALLSVPAPPAAFASDAEAAVWTAALQEAFRESDRFRACPAEDLAEEFPGFPEIRVSHEYLPPDLLSWPGAEGSFVPLPPSGGSSSVNLHLAEDRASVHLFLKVSEALSPSTSKRLLEALNESWGRLALVDAAPLPPGEGPSDEEFFAGTPAPSRASASASASAEEAARAVRGAPELEVNGLAEGAVAAAGIAAGADRAAGGGIYAAGVDVDAARAAGGDVDAARAAGGDVDAA